MSTIAAKYEIPILLTTYNPDAVTTAYRMLASQGTSFLINAPTFYKYRQLIRSYLQTGIKSIVAVANQGSSNYNIHSCMGAADELLSRGVQVMDRFIIGPNDSTPRVKEIVNLIKQLNPDAGKTELYIFVFIYRNTYIYICIYVRKCIVYIYTYIYVKIHICMYIHKCILYKYTYLSVCAYVNPCHIYVYI